MDFSGPEPIYLQIASDIRAQILAGDLGDGDQVMSTTEYATTYRINPATAAKAFTILEQEGLVEKRRGLGVFIAPGASEVLRRERRATFQNDSIDPFADDIVRLGLEVEDVVARVRAAVAERLAYLQEDA
ncbi:GntR family transcriptional regulator [Bowdeniella nasicola]|uniref:GntR family transcriptional regulator n=1 Tax=Bowdeniella nasicola TaxID=208480 RepID=A0A1Q5Q0Q0_9ACTO|nr:GntR family transcriptional regulator [Bowdeniella nasicola]OKL53272.1 GntR family transcriptional regulator [Bowdeniella nasicola]